MQQLHFHEPRPPIEKPGNPEQAQGAGLIRLNGGGQAGTIAASLDPGGSEEGGPGLRGEGSLQTV